MALHQLLTVFFYLTELFHTAATFADVVSKQYSIGTAKYCFIPIDNRRFRGRRYAIEGSFWGVKTLTYRISSGSSSLSMPQLKDIFRRAFETWEEHSELKFIYREQGEVHIEVIFTTGAHGDGEPFDGRGKILAHAFFPRYGGDLHFDDDELWSINKNEPGLDLYAVAVHEIGHSLGLKHSHESKAIMAPFYQSYSGDKLHLHPDDLTAISRLYGPSGAANKDKMVTSTSPSICKTGYIDAITKVFNGSLYAFQGQYFWKLSVEDGPEPGFPKLIHDYWNIDGPVDAVMTNQLGNTYIFKNSDYYVFSKVGHLMDGYPKSIEKGLQDMPTQIDAALIWHYDNQPYFFKKDKYWKYSRYGMPTAWPKSISALFRGKVPQKIDAGLMLGPNATYIFSGKYFWRLGNRSMKILNGYPKLISDFWFNCDGKRHIEK